MSYNFFSPHRSDLEVSSLHGRRILGPFLAACILRLHGVDLSSRLQFSYDASQNPREQWGAFQIDVYDKIQRAWQALDFLAYVLLTVALVQLLPASLFTSSSIVPLLLFNLMLTPSLGLLMVFWPQMNDLLGLALLGWSLVFFQRQRELPALVMIGFAAIAREQMLMMLPLIYCFFRFSVPKALLLAGIPYFASVFYPVFPNTVPLVDSSSAEVVPTTSVLDTYAHLFHYHWNFLWSQRGLVQPYAIALNLGAVLLFLKPLDLWRDKRFWLILALCFLFMADRHMAPLALVALAGLRVGPMVRDLSLRLNQIRTPLMALLLFKLALLLCATNARWLQAEFWYTFFWPAKYYRYFFQGVWVITALSLAFLWLWRRRRRSAVPSAVIH